MAFAASHHTRHDVALRVAPSTVCHGMPIWIGVGDTNIYLSRKEATRLAADLLDAAGAAPVESQQVSA